MTARLLGEFVIPKTTRKNTLEKIKKYLSKPRGFFHIVSLNPENIVVALQNRTFKRIIRKAQINIIDGIGIVRAAQILNLEAGERYPGVDLMNHLISYAGKMRLRVLFIGGRLKLAENLAKCYQQNYPQARFTGIKGIKNIKKSADDEMKEIERIVRATRPHLVFVAFGSPYQELWLYKHKHLFTKCVSMGVGGAFDYLGGSIQRPNAMFRRLGLEWLIRLVKQPWRWRRQMRLLKFIYFVIKQKVHETLEIPHS